jgi:hypothetical protein
MTETNLHAHIYNTLLTVVPASVLDVDNITPLFKYIAMDIGQLEYADRPGVLFPALLIDFEAENYSDAAAGIQLCDCILLLRVAFAPFEDESGLAPSDVRTRALKYFDIEAKLHTVMQNLNDADFGGTTRISAAIEKREDNLRVRQLRYNIAWKDDSAFIQTTMPKPPLDATAQVIPISGE